MIHDTCIFLFYFEKKIEKNNKKIYCILYKYVIIIKYKIIKKNKNFFQRRMNNKCALMVVLVYHILLLARRLIPPDPPPKDSLQCKRHQKIILFFLVGLPLCCNVRLVLTLRKGIIISTRLWLWLTLIRTCHIPCLIWIIHCIIYRCFPCTWVCCCISNCSCSCFHS